MPKMIMVVLLLVLYCGKQASAEEYPVKQCATARLMHHPKIMASVREIEGVPPYCSFSASLPPKMSAAVEDPLHQTGVGWEIALAEPREAQATTIAAKVVPYLIQALQQDLDQSPWIENGGGTLAKLLMSNDKELVACTTSLAAGESYDNGKDGLKLSCGSAGNGSGFVKARYEAISSTVYLPRE